jgi:hypothetical protein
VSDPKSVCSPRALERVDGSWGGADMNRTWQPDGAAGLCSEAKVSDGSWREVERETKSVVRIAVLVVI